MRVQEYNTGSKFDEQDLLSGSAFIEKGKYLTKNFKLKDILNNIKAGLPASSGLLSIKLITQEEFETQLTPEAFINENEEGVIIPPYAVTLVRMNSNALYIFTRTGQEFGVNAFQCDTSDFILINSPLGAEFSSLGEDLDYFGLVAADSQKTLNMALNEAFKGEAGQAEYVNNFNVLKSDHTKIVFVETGNTNKAMFVPVFLDAGFQATYIQIGTGDVTISMSNPDNLIGKTTIGGDGKSVRVIKRIQDNKIYVI